MSNKIKVLIVEDYTKIAEAWSTILSQEGFVITGICSGEKETLDQVEGLSPDVVLMDINLNEGNGISCTKELKAILPNCQIIGLSMYNDDKYLNDMLSAGASAYVTKNSSIKEIIQAIEVVNAGGTYICEEMRND